MPAIRLDPWTHIKEVGWERFTHFAFSIDLGIGQPMSDILLSCGGGIATGDFIAGWSPGYTYPYALSSQVSGYRNGEWVTESVTGVSISGLPSSDTANFDPGTVSPQFGQIDASRINPVSGGSSGIVVPGRSDQFSSSVSAFAELVTVLGDGNVYCAGLPGLAELGSNAIGGAGNYIPGGAAQATVLSHVTATYRGRTLTPVGTFTIPRTIPGPITADMPKTIWCLLSPP